MIVDDAKPFNVFVQFLAKKCGFIASGPVWICSKICILCFFYFAFAFCVFYFVFLSCILTGKDCHRISDDESQVATGGPGQIFATFNIRFAIF